MTRAALVGGSFFCPVSERRGGPAFCVHNDSNALDRPRTVRHHGIGVIMSEHPLREAGTVSFGERLAASQAFTALFREGMALVEETAAYLDGDGRQEAKALPRSAALAYATESMRLTTRLMQLASWLLLH